MRKSYVCCVLLALAGCSESAPPPAPAPKQAVAKPKPVDEGRRFPLEDQVSMEVVNDKLLGKDFLPGGNLAQYKHKAKTYRQFLVHAKSPEDAAILLITFKGALRDSKYLAHMGGYFGFDGDQPVYVFPKKSFLAGFVGLPEKDADVLARQFAARID